MKSPQKIDVNNIRAGGHNAEPYSIYRLAKIRWLTTGKEELGPVKNIQDFPPLTFVIQDDS